MLHHNQFKKLNKSKNVTLKNDILCILAAILNFWLQYWILGKI